MKKVFFFFCLMLVVSFTRATYAYTIFVDKSGLYHDAGLPDWLRSLGNTVTTVNDYSGENLSSYDMVMDFGYDQFTGLNSLKKAAYSSYLGGGGSLYLQGEKPSVYGYYDTILLNYLKNDLGAGPITALMTQDLYLPPSNSEVTTVSPVTSDTSLNYLVDYSLGITNPGNGFFVVHTYKRANVETWPYTYELGDWSNIIGFDHGDLSNFPAGKLIASFDITYLNVNGAPFQTNQVVLKKIVDYLGTDPVLRAYTVPEPSTFGLIGMGVLTIVAGNFRRKRRKL